MLLKVSSLHPIRIAWGNVERHFRMEAAGVEGKQEQSMIQLLSGWTYRSRPNVGWFPFVETSMCIDGPKGLEVRWKSSIGVEVVVTELTREITE